MAARSVPLAADGQVHTGKCKLLGWTARESAGSPAVANAVVRDGTGTSDPIVGRIGMVASGSNNAWFGPQGIAINTGIYFDLTAGSIDVTVFFE